MRLLERRITALAIALFVQLALLVCGPRAVQAEMYSFACITHNLAQDCAIGEL